MTPVMVFGLFAGDLPQADHFIDERMVARQPVERALTQQVTPCVAGMGDECGFDFGHVL